MAKKKLTKLEQMGIIALIAVIACFFYVKKVYEPGCKEFKKLEEEWGKLSKEIKELEWQEGGKDASSSIREKEEELEKAKSEFKKTSSVLTDKGELAEMLTQISRLAGQSNLRIREFSPADKKELQDKKELSLNRSSHKLIITGSFLDFKDFLKEIGVLPKLVTVKKVVIERESEGESLRITLLLSI